MTTNETPTPEVVIEKLEMDQNHVDIMARHPAFALIAMEIGKMLKDHKAENFITVTMRDETEKYEVTVRKIFGKTPEEKMNELKDEIDEWKVSRHRLAEAYGKLQYEYDNTCEKLRIVQAKQNSER